MHKQMESVINALEERPDSGLTSEDQEILRALRNKQGQADLSNFFDKGFTITEVARVCEMQNSLKVVEVLVRLKSPAESTQQETPRLVIKYDAVKGDLISISKLFVEEEDLYVKRGSALPFALAAPSFTEAVQALEDDPNLCDVNTRRRKHLEDMGPFAPMMSATSYPTTSETGYPSANQTPYPTSGVTTPNDNDTRTDERADTSQDTRTDTTQDTRSDD